MAVPELQSWNDWSLKNRRCSSLHLDAGVERHDATYVGGWVSRESATTKFICTGTYGPGSSLSEKGDAQKKAKAACEYAQRQDSSREVSFWFQTKETQAPS